MQKLINLVLFVLRGNNDDNKIDFNCRFPGV